MVLRVIVWSHVFDIPIDDDILNWRLKTKLKEEERRFCANLLIYFLLYFTSTGKATEKKLNYLRIDYVCGERNIA